MPSPQASSILESLQRDTRLELLVFFLEADPHTQRHVHAVREACARDGIKGDPHLTAPHITLGTLSIKHVPGLQQKLSAAIPDRPFEYPLSEISVFPNGTVYLTGPKPAAVADFHDSMHHILSASGTILEEWYKPEIWVPHCTIVEAAAANQVAAVRAHAERLLHLPLRTQLTQFVGIAVGSENGERFAIEFQRQSLR